MGELVINENLKYLFIALILSLSCTSKNSSPEVVNFVIDNGKGDTLNEFDYPLIHDYYFLDQDNLDSAIFNKEARKRISGTLIFGLIQQETFLNRQLTFKGVQNSNFSHFEEPSDFFLHEEYNLDNYEVVILNDYYDSDTKPLTRHQMLAAVDLGTSDTLIFQELNIAQKSNYVLLNLITYETWEIRDEMHELMTDLLSRIKN